MRSVGCLVLLLSAGVAVADEPKPKPKWQVGKETTYVTGPIDKNGYIDFEAALNDRLGKDITPEKNANVLLWKAKGPTPEGGKGMPPEFFKRLGMQEPPKEGDYLVGMYRYLTDHLKLDQTEHQAIYDQQTWAGQRPWTPTNYPHIANWLKLNEKPLAVAVEATKRPEYYNPLVSFRKNDEPTILIGALLPGGQKCREIGSALTARAIRRHAEGKTDEAWQDLIACHRLGRLVGRGATLIEALVGYALNQIASNATLAYLERAKLDSKQILARLKELQDLPPIPPIADKIELGERIMYLDSLQFLRRGGVGQLEGLAGGQVKKPTPEELQALDMIDWEPALRSANKWYDRMARAMRLKTRADREKEFGKMDEDLKALKKDAVQPANLAKLALGKDPDKLVGKAIGDILLALLMPAVRKVQDSHDRALQVEQNLHLAFALAAYHKDNGRYPAKLADLAPKYIASVSNDIFTDKPLIYKPTDKGYLFYSVGVNGKDEDGRWVDDDPRGDDPGVRMPLPELKKKQ